MRLLFWEITESNFTCKLLTSAAIFLQQGQAQKTTTSEFKPTQSVWNVCKHIEHGTWINRPRINRPTNEPKIIFYRSFKNFSEDRYKKDLEDAPFHVSQVFEDVDDQMWYHNTLLNTIVDKNAPKKQKRITFKPLPYMNDNQSKYYTVREWQTLK